ncbi:MULTISPECIES: TetR/AcrR family transcriptional regulator C-terminal domain-containing protein [Paenibacillus]|uniref:TetR/AcrR family transcriptional regulator C-terminal domain-containing protein n=1 Tax=Paenibacillus TaxID=44249 RepID=UPI0022B884A1|nr:TetR/AcrR family transcriptional regulator C-terminal domain-containing protein [Paenibacillus caseinilyticus]MCZ8520480.1 TetR/AcrR family transcriptional regulator C-terminal domain-containing protein [Paenibacillus caseinilyticus]
MARRRIHTGESDGPSGTLHQPLGRERIVTAVLEMLQEMSLEQITMRGIADSLGVKAASLYYHVKDKEELLHLLAERISLEVPFPDQGLPWQEQLKQWALNFRRTLHQYRSSVPIMGATIAASPNRLSHIEYLYRVLADAGFADAHIPWLAAMLKNHVLSYAEEEIRLQDRAAREHTEDAEEMSRRYAQQFQSLPPEQYPHMIRLAARTTAMDGDQEFGFALEVLLEGFRSKLTE